MNSLRLIRWLPILLLTLFPFLFATTTFAHATPKQAGQITEYALPAGAAPFGITAGSDGNLLFVESAAGKIGKITAA